MKPIRTIVSIIGLAAVITMSTGAAPADNLLHNPGFETGEAAPLPEPWRPFGGDNPMMGREVTDNAHSGERAALITDQSGKARKREYASGLMQKVPMGDAEFYKVSCWTKCIQRDRRNAAWLQLRFEPSNKRFNTHLNTTSHGEWQRFVAAGRAPEGSTAIRVYIKTLHWAKCRYIVDNFVLKGLRAEGQQLPLLEYGSEGVQYVRDLNLHTPLVEGGQAACHICAAQGEGWSQAGRRLAQGIEKKTGATVPMRQPAKEALQSRKTTIAIGNINNNFILERMWLNRYQRVDDRHPGPGAYILQTIPEPYDCPNGKNVVIVGASNIAGANAGIDALLDMLGNGENLAIDKWLLEVSDNSPMSKKRRQQLLAEDLSKYWLRDFWRAARKYQRTGDIAYAMRARKVLLAQAKRYVDYAEDDDAKITDYWPAPTSRGTHRIYWPEETSSEWIGAMWDFIEECHVFGDDDRARCTNALLLTLYDLPRHVHAWNSLADRETTEPVQFNHTTFPMLGIYFLARYFDRFYPDVDGWKIDDFMNRTHNCFRAQMKSWKAQEDATGYLSIVPRHTITYSLAEGDYSYFRSNRVRKLCRYTIGICDNTGDPANFGDSGYGHGIYTRNLKWAVWYYDDPAVLWWLQHVKKQRGGTWNNPFNDIQPRPPKGMVGITPFQLSRPVYDFTKSHSYYGTERRPPNVPYEKSFDKISFRENLDPDGEFFLLDGYSRGGHLHYDGNAINKFFADGEDWLIDGDYLVRNTTDHNMLSLTKDGRCAEYEPPCTALEHIADLPAAKLTQTSVYGYNGADWDRNILWLPGDLVCLIDRVRAKDAGEFNCEIIFKMIDRGTVGTDHRRIVMMRRMAGGKPGKHGLSVVKNPTENVAAAVKFTDKFSRLDFPVTLPKGGPYGVHIIGYGIDGGTDSFWVKADRGDKTAFHLPLNKFSRSFDSGVNPKGGSRPKMSIDAGRHLITITLRESPNVMLDCVEFVDGAGNVVKTIQAENAPKVPEAMLADAPPDKLFYIKNDGHSRLVQSTRFNHKRMPIRYVHHKFGDRLKSGDAVTNQAAFFNTDTAENAAFDIRRINPDTCLITENRKPLGIFFTSPEGLNLPEAVTTDAPIGYLSKDYLALCDTTRAGPISADAPADIGIDLNTGNLQVIADRPTTITIGDFTKTIEGNGSIDLDDAAGEAVSRPWRDAFDDLAGRAKRPAPAGAGHAITKKNMDRLWNVDGIEHDGQLQKVLHVKATDIDGDDNSEYLAIRGRFLSCIDTDGTVTWQFDGNDELYSVSAHDCDGDDSQEIFVGGKDTHLYMLSANGELLHDHKIQTYHRSTRTTIHEPRLDDVLVEDYDRDGNWEAALGTVDGFTQLIDHKFRQQWIFGETNHGTTEFQAIDCNHDGVLDLAVGNRYGKMFVFDIQSGDTLAYVRSELGDCQIAAADIDTDGAVELMNGSATGAFVCENFDSGNQQWTFHNYGYRVRDIKTGEFTADDRQLVAVASDTEYVYLVSASGEQLSQRNLHSAVLNLAVVPTPDGPPLLAAGCLNGALYLLDGDLNIAAQFPLASEINWVEPAGNPATVVAGTTDGRVIKLQLN